MPVGSWWLVDDSLQKVMAGPFLWDGTTPWSPPPGQRAVSTDPTTAPMNYALQTIPAAPDMTAVLARITAIEQRLYATARGVRPTPAISLGQTLNARVTLKTPMRDASGQPTTNYTPAAVLVQGPNISSLSIAAALVVVDAQNVDVPVKSTLGNVAGAGTLVVFADVN